ncbi:MAG: HD domain-containing phosphohydrolase [Ilumatobacteraceae bacterium]
MADDLDPDASSELDETGGGVDVAEPAAAPASASSEDGPPALAFFEGDVTEADLVIPLDETDVICWVPSPKPPVVAALEVAGLQLTGDADGATHCVVSTRLPRHRISEYVSLAQSLGTPVVILVNPGGEALAIEALAAGADVAIAEGDPIALRALAGDERAIASRTNAILEAYEARIGRHLTGNARPSAASLVSPVTGLPAYGALAAKIAAPPPETALPNRIISFSLPGLADPSRLRMSAEAGTLLHRRLGALFKHICIGHGDLFDLGEGSFVLISPGMTESEAVQLGEAIIDVVASYTPDSHLPLLVAIGHAGPESSTDLPTLRELAGRAEATAAKEERSSVLGAGELAGPLATATELEVTMRLAELAESRVGGPARSTVAQLASDIAGRLGFEGEERLLVRFCAHVANVGNAVGSTQALAPEELAARVVGATAGPFVAAALRHVTERWDGSGKPDGLAGPSIPAAARIVAVAEALATADSDPAIVEAGAGTLFDPTVVAAAVEVLRKQ